MGWMYFLDYEAILVRVGPIVVVEGLCDVEIAIAQTMRGSLGEIESVSSTARMIGGHTM